MRFELFAHYQTSLSWIHLRRYCPSINSLEHDVRKMVEWATHINNETKLSAFVSSLSKSFQKKYSNQISSVAPTRGFGKGTGIWDWLQPCSGCCWHVTYLSASRTQVQRVLRVAKASPHVCTSWPISVHQVTDGSRWLSSFQATDSFQLSSRTRLHVH